MKTHFDLNRFDAACGIVDEHPDWAFMMVKDIDQVTCVDCLRVLAKKCSTR